VIHDHGGPLLAFDWTPIVVALISLAGVVISCGTSVWIALQLRTPSGTRIGKQVEGAHLTSIANNHELQVLKKQMGLPTRGAFDLPDTERRSGDPG
jgi:hypothetical protein